LLKAFFALTVIGLLAMSAVAWSLAPEAHHDGKTELSWCSDDNPMRRPQIALFNQMFPSCRLSLDPSNTGLEKVIVQSIGGVGPDIFDCYSPFQLSAYVKAGIAWDITDKLKAGKMDPREICWPGVRVDAVLDDRVYGFPTNAAANGIWFHKDVFDAAGLPYPPRGQWYWPQLVELAKKLTIRDPKTGKITQYGFMCDWTVDYPQFLMQWGANVYSDDGTRCTLDTPQAAAAIQFLTDLIYVYKVSPTPTEEQAMATTGGWGSGVISLFGAKRAAMAMGGRWWLCAMREMKGLHLGAAESPINNIRVFRGYGKATLINVKSPNRDAAFEFMKYLASKPYNELINSQADGMGPVMKYTETEKFLHNPEHPEEDYNDVWRNILRDAQPDQVSPFVNGPAVDRIITKQLDLIKMRAKSAAQGMADATREVNEHIQKQLKRDPTLRERYEALTHTRVQ
jgi:ABC-type glycerol-3-phosphate transport system substrate-binding protein